MRSSYWITKATNRQSEHVIIIIFPRQQLLRERTSIRRCMHISFLVAYKEEKWILVLFLYVLYELYCIKTYSHSYGFILCTETEIAQSLQLLGYVLCNRGPRVRFRMCKRLYYTICRSVVGSVKKSTNLVLGVLSLG